MTYRSDDVVKDRSHEDDVDDGNVELGRLRQVPVADRGELCQV